MDEWLVYCQERSLSDLICSLSPDFLHGIIAAILGEFDMIECVFKGWDFCAM